MEEKAVESSEWWQGYFKCFPPKFPLEEGAQFL